MARKAQFPPKITRHHTGQARVSYRGRDYYLGLHGSPEAERAYAALLARLAGGQADTGDVAAGTRGAAALTVGDVAGRFLDAARAERPAGQLVGYRRALAPLVRLLGGLPAADLDADHLERLRLAMLTGSWQTEEERDAQRRTKGTVGWCRTNAARHLTRVKTCWRWAERRKLVPPGSWGNLRSLPPLAGDLPGVRHAERRRATTRAELDAVLPRVQERKRHRPCAAMLELQWLTGMRPGEVCVMRPCDIDRDGGPVVDGVRVWLYRPHRWKCSHLGLPRVVALGPGAQAILAPWLADCPADAYLFRPKLGARHPRYSPANYYHVVRRAARKAGVRLCPYGSRHGAKDRVTRAGGLDAARAVLGHTSVAQTAEYGDRLDLETAARVAAQLG